MWGSLVQFAGHQCDHRTRGQVFPPVACNSCYMALIEATEMVRYYENSTKYTCMVISHWLLPAVLEDQEITNQHFNTENSWAELRRSLYVSLPIYHSKVPSPFLDDLICHSCHCIRNQTVELTTSHHHFYMKCIKDGLVACPCNGSIANCQLVNQESRKEKPLASFYILLYAI